MGLFLIQLNDTEREGDGTRSIINWKILLLFFRSRNKGQKYAFESMRFISHIKALYTEKMAHRTIHGRVVNYLGGEGKNVANYLKQEHYVKKNKKYINALGAQKTLNAVSRVTGASHGVDDIVSNLEKQTNIHRQSSKHTVASAEDDERKMIKVLRELKPFTSIPSRKHSNFPNITSSPFDELDSMLLKTWLIKHKSRLARNRNAAPELEENITESDNDQDDDNDQEEDDVEVEGSDDSGDELD